MAVTETKALSASLEDYLEAIFQIMQVKPAARAKDIGKRMRVSRSSVTGALHALAERDLINYAPYDLITLTRKGKVAARDVVKRHEALRGFFVRVLAVEDAEADAAACKMEHAIPEGILERFAKFIDFLETQPCQGSDWAEAFDRYCQQEETSDQMKDVPASVTLATVKPGRRAKIIKISGVGGIRRRLLDMGATAGTVVEVERIAPLGDPIEIKIKGYHLTLRKSEAGRIEVVLV